jgi:predicted O-methyltransferase YrrM
LTAFEAAACKTLVISNNLAALSETVGNRGINVLGNVESIEWQNEILNKLFEVMSGNSDPFKLINDNYSYVSKRSWEQQTQKFINILGINYEGHSNDLNHGGMLNWTHDKPTGTRSEFYEILKLLPINSNILEIGSYAGISIIEILKIVPYSKATVIDSWSSYREHDNILNTITPTENISNNNIYQVFLNNLKVSGFESKVNILHGDSIEKLLELISQGNLFDFIYIDASHKCLDCYADSILAWKLLRVGGIIAFDDVPFNMGDTLNSPFDAVKHFTTKYSSSIEILKENYRVFIRKTN